jgi:hypothetical protein
LSNGALRHEDVLAEQLHPAVASVHRGVLDARSVRLDADAGAIGVLDRQLVESQTRSARRGVHTVGIRPLGMPDRESLDRHVLRCDSESRARAGRAARAAIEDHLALGLDRDSVEAAGDVDVFFVRSRGDENRVSGTRRENAGLNRRLIAGGR